MIKVINGYKLKQGADLQPVLLKLREHAMSYPGYVGAENLVSDKDPSIVAIITTWDKRGAVAGLAGVEDEGGDNEGGGAAFGGGVEG